MLFKYSELQRAWLDDLKTTTAEQGPNYLRKGDSFCCLGRACEVMGIQRVQTTAGHYEYGEDGEVAGLGYDAEELLGLYSGLGDGRGVAKALTVLNDSGDYTFKQIAELIESNPEVYLKEKV